MDLLNFTLASTAEEMEAIVPVAAMVIGMIVAVVAIGGGIIKSVINTNAREKTKREVAAYVAEGSIRAEDAERIIAAGGKDKCG